MEEFPKEVNKVSYDQLLRIPGVGPVTAKRIIQQRKLSQVTYEGLKKMGVVLKRSKYFITCQGRYFGGIDLNPEIIKYKLGDMEESRQLSFWR
jgi:predicted DNA-binding helix-hairpin-helix protein